MPTMRRLLILALVLAPANTYASVSPTAPRVILTTRGITDELTQTFSKLLREVVPPGEDPRIALVITAALAPRCPSCTSAASTQSSEVPDKLALQASQREEIERSSSQLQTRLGARVQLVDCAHDSAEYLAEVLQRSHCVYVLGGNTFYLLWHMRRSGLDAMIQRRVLQEGAVYVGCSAGSIVAGRSISTAFWKGWDNPLVVPNADWESPNAVAALGLVGVSLFPHYEAERHETLVQQRRDELGHELVTLAEMGPAYILGGPA